MEASSTAEQGRDQPCDRSPAREQAQWKEVFEHNPVMYFMVDANGTVLSVNTFGAAQLGYLVGEFAWAIGAEGFL